MKADEITEWIADDAIRYVHKHKSWSEDEENAAIEKMNEENCGIADANPKIAQEIDKLLEEFTKQNDMPSEWWLDWFEVDSILETPSYL